MTKPTRKMVVLWVLEQAKLHESVYVDGQTITCPDGWVHGPLLTRPSVGGSEGLRRLRELRDDGYVIEMVKPHRKFSSRAYRILGVNGIDDK